MESTKSLFSNPVTIVLIIIISWLCLNLALLSVIPSWKIRSAFGDMSTAVNSIYSGLALAGVVYAILLQRKDIQLQRQELKAARKELEKSAEAQRESEEALREQIDAQRTVARLSALSSILSHYDERMGPGVGIEKHYSKEEAEDVIEEINNLMDELREE